MQAATLIRAHEKEGVVPAELADLARKVYRAAAEHLLRLGDPELETWMWRLIRLDPDDPWAYAELGQWYRFGHRTFEAGAIWSEGFARFPLLNDLAERLIGILTNHRWLQQRLKGITIESVIARRERALSDPRYILQAEDFGQERWRLE